MGVNTNSTVPKRLRHAVVWFALGLVLVTIAWLQSDDEYTLLEFIEIEVRQESPAEVDATPGKPSPPANVP